MRSNRQSALYSTRLTLRTNRPNLSLLRLKAVPDESKAPLLSLLAIPATSDALKAVIAAVDSPDRTVSDAAVRALGDWPNPEPVDTLYRIASSGNNPVHKILALRGYIRLAPLTKDPSSSYAKALKLAKQTNEIRLILGGLHNAGTLKALEIAESYMDNKELKSEAYMAAAKVANVFCFEDGERTRKTLDKIIKDAPNDGIKNQARNVLKKMDQFKGVIAVWKGTKLFKVKDVADGRFVFNNIFEPEKNFDSEAIVWRTVWPEFEGGGRLDLEKTYGPVDFCCAYLKTTIISPKDQQVKLDWQVDDLIKGWLNGKEINAGSISLKKGANTFIVKVGDHAGGWSFLCRILNSDGSALAGLRYER